MNGYVNHMSPDDHYQDAVESPLVRADDDQMILVYNQIILRVQQRLDKIIGCGEIVKV